jgi:hypothetical protein
MVFQETTFLLLVGIASNSLRTTSTPLPWRWYGAQEA